MHFIIYQLFREFKNQYIETILFLILDGFFNYFYKSMKKIKKF